MPDIRRGKKGCNLVQKRAPLSPFHHWRPRQSTVLGILRETPKNNSTTPCPTYKSSETTTLMELRLSSPATHQQTSSKLSCHSSCAMIHPLDLPPLPQSPSIFFPSSPRAPDLLPSFSDFFPTLFLFSLPVLYKKRRPHLNAHPFILQLIHSHLYLQTFPPRVHIPPRLAHDYPNHGTTESVAGKGARAVRKAQICSCGYQGGGRGKAKMSGLDAKRLETGGIH